MKMSLVICAFVFSALTQGCVIRPRRGVVVVRPAPVVVAQPAPVVVQASPSNP